MAGDLAGDDSLELKSRLDAQKIAFAPIMFQAARSLRNLGILEFILLRRRRGATIADISTALDLSFYGVKVLVEAGLSLELLSLDDDKYFITRTGYYILRDELTRVNMDFTHDVNYQGMFYLEDAILSGKPEGLKVFGNWNTVYEALSELPEPVRKSWFDFDHFYSDEAFPEVMPHLFKDHPKKILDVGGNTGKFSIFCCHHNPDVEMTILDLPGQIHDARINIQKNGFEKRIHTQALDLLDHSIPFPKNHDVVWMSQFLDCFSVDEIDGLLKRARDAIGPDGSLFILETCWDNQKYEASTYSLHATSLYFTAIANGNSQMYHTNDLVSMIEKAGLYVDELNANISLSHTLFKCKSKTS